MQKRKKRLIVLTSMLSVVLVIVVLASTLFNLKTVRVEFKTNTILKSIVTDDQIAEAGQFDYGTNLLFTDVSKYANNIEKSIGYAKVLKIERVFPSTIAVHIVERTPCVLIENGTSIIVLDDTLKVLRVTTKELLYEANDEKLCPILDADGFNVSALEVGSFANNESLKNEISAIHAGIYANGKSIVILENVKIYLGESSELKIELKLKSDKGNGTVYISGAEELKPRVTQAFSLVARILGSSNPNFEYINVSAGGQITCDRSDVA